MRENLKHYFKISIPLIERKCITSLTGPFYDQHSSDSAIYIINTVYVHGHSGSLRPLVKSVIYITRVAMDRSANVNHDHL